ncbi:3-methyl-2-oxobutanoate hydroxymethyltransferase [Campylobacter jejuni]|uniref:3-methyl-2-oxobutanoate hydroxymethyltransferase n=1 Tax=Campylobacter jejuni TaxID=197 RepID=UPI00126D3EC8|nr:3-methyl-2-oxobutanoate hydroxymethyltransferase [Campylobacter jejuni]EAI0658311.1 3-methyl-2-oxobutanoate hydroxymethyltransferase [Campylobacter jejuni]EAI0658705.1 3-methyl-2-oxobutanoate hydroxymethyltransferase [Campylobacter jejuni]EAJ1175440.1 3-methyl-2-oxobutanoate hydroxymethyltransferase [Campylobacter jejuni]EAJ2589598.1 3-methyl-2-oxobutanoate hydroxymethyltransferase [Campylobacter jejuni]EAJ2590205.1 3-methyl-2-oxobutanoate hydroxymethyltransferase [Campylobacter jejuni]
MRKSILSFLEKKGKNEKITMVSAYDYHSAKILDNCDIDIILVGDSLAMTVLGMQDTLSVTMDEMLIFTKAVSRGAKKSFVLADMPFMSYQSSDRDAILNASRFIKESHANGVKVEGDIEIASKIKLISQSGIPVVAHLGLTPQAVNMLGGYRVQGKDLQSAQKIIDDAKAVQDAGACMLVLECVPVKLAQKISSILEIPTIGIGSGKYCDGQVLVYHDLLGLNKDFKAKFVKHFDKIDPQVGVEKYRDEVKSGIFPSEEHSFDYLDDELLDKLY